MTEHLSTRLAAGLSAYSVSRERDKLLSLWRFAARKRHVDEWPDVPPIKLPRRIPHALTLDQVDRLLNAARETPGMIGDAPAGEWWSAYYLVAITTGERTGAMLSLEWSMLRGDWLVVPGEIRKCSSPASYRLPAAVVAAVRRLFQNADQAKIFSAPWGRCTFYLRNKKILRRAGLPATREYQPQMCRRTFASWLEASGGNATEALGHSTRKITRASYLDPTIVVGEQPGFTVAARFGIG